MNIDFESRNITRRSFLKGAGVVGAAGLLSACGGSVQQLRQLRRLLPARKPPTLPVPPPSRSTSPGVANREIESWNLLYSQTPPTQTSSPTCGTA